MNFENLLLGALGCIYSPNLPPQGRGYLQPLSIPGDTLHGEAVVGEINDWFYKPYTLTCPGASRTPVFSALLT